jgi:two-component system, sporulation sensor kinase E
MNKQCELTEIERMADSHSSIRSQRPIHLFGIMREREGIYSYTYSAGALFDELKMATHPLPGTNLHELYSEYHLAKWVAPLEKAFHGEIQRIDIKVSNKHIRTSLYPVRDENDKIFEVACISSEVLPLEIIRRNLDQNMQRFKQLFNYARDAIVLCDSAFKIVEANQTACALLELKREELLNQKITALFLKSKQHQIEKNWEDVLNGKKISGEFSYSTSNGLLKEIEYTCEKDRVPEWHVILLKDITDQKETEQKLLKAETLNVVGELAAGVAHEIRNPLTSLKGFVQLIRNQTKDYDQYLSIILSEVDRIEHIIKEFLVLSKSHSQSFESTNIKDIVRDTVELLNSQAILKNVEIKTEYDEHFPLLYCDPMQLKQVFINFVKNAIEASSPGESVEVGIKKDREYIQVQIRDNGCGMDEDTLSKIGKPFFTTKEEGTGLGMMVSNNIIKHHNGKIDVKSEIGKGTEFLISLPVKKRP